MNCGNWSEVENHCQQEDETCVECLRADRVHISNMLHALVSNHFTRISGKIERGKTYS